MINNSNSTTYLATNGTYSNLQLKDKKTKNDCTVRSISTAFDVSFRTAFKLAEDKFMREPGKGVSSTIIQDAFESGKFNKVDGRKFSVRTMKKDEITNRYKLKGEIILRKKTVKSFIASHPKGTYYVLVSNHAFTVKDGELLDHGNFGNQPTRKVQGAFQVVGEKVDNGQLEFNF
jgi:hypothetical protein